MEGTALVDRVIHHLLHLQRKLPAAGLLHHCSRGSCANCVNKACSLVLSSLFATSRTVAAAVSCRQLRLSPHLTHRPPLPPTPFTHTAPVLLHEPNKPHFNCGGGLATSLCCSFYPTSPTALLCPLHPSPMQLLYSCMNLMNLTSSAGRPGYITLLQLTWGLTSRSVAQDLYNALSLSMNTG